MTKPQYKLSTEILNNSDVFCSTKDIDTIINYLIRTGRIPVALAEEPTPHEGTADITELVIEDIEMRATMGESKYGTRLKAFNGRDSLKDAYHEAVDLVVYLRQLIEESKVT